MFDLGAVEVDPGNLVAIVQQFLHYGVELYEVGLGSHIVVDENVIASTESTLEPCNDEDVS